ncbi:ketoacyl-synthetase C-terminal extension domain-containing protein [Streptomyces nogalater]
MIRGTAVNHGGRTSGYMVPNPVAQGELVAAALRDAGVEPHSIGYLEAHGTGTALGDPVEISGLARAFAGVEAGTCPIGSVKSNIGHLEAAAGLAGLTKVLLQLRHRRLVPSLHAEQLNPDIDWSRSPFAVQHESAPWPARRTADGTPVPRRAGLSAFGAGGANAHLVIEEYLPEPTAEPIRPAGPQLFTLSARDEQRLTELARRWAEFLTRPELPPFADLAHTTQSGREPLRERLAVVAAGRPNCARKSSASWTATAAAAWCAAVRPGPTPPPDRTPPTARTATCTRSPGTGRPGAGSTGPACTPVPGPAGPPPPAIRSPAAATGPSSRKPWRPHPCRSPTDGSRCSSPRHGEAPGSPGPSR